jgi:hypothetical protein
MPIPEYGDVLARTEPLFHWLVPPPCAGFNTSGADSGGMEVNSSQSRRVGEKLSATLSLNIVIPTESGNDNVAGSIMGRPAAELPVEERLRRSGLSDLCAFAVNQPPWPHTANAATLHPHDR